MCHGRRPAGWHSVMVVPCGFDCGTAALLLSLTSRHEDPTVTGLPDPLASPCAFHGPSEVSLLCVTQLYDIGTSYYKCFLQTVKASGVILLFGVGSLVCYRLYDQYRRGDSFPPPTTSGASPSKKRRFRDLLGLFIGAEEEQLVEDTEDDDPALISSHYFGPAASGDDAKLSPTSSSDSADEDNSAARSAGAGDADVSSEGLELLEEAEEVTGEEAETKGNMGHTESKYEPVHYSPEVGVVFNHLQSSVENSACWHSTPSVNAYSTTPKHARKSVSLQAVPSTTRIEDDEGPSSVVRRDSDSLYSDSPLSVTELQRLVKEGSLEVDLEGLRDCEDLGITTVTSLEQLEKQLVDIKDLCADMNGELGCLRFPHAPPLLPGDCGSSRKNSLSTTVSDYSISAAGATAEQSGQEVVNLHKRRAQFRGLLGGLSLDLTYLSSTSSPSSCSEETSQASLEWDSPRHGWTTLPRSRASRRSAAAALHSPVNGGSSLKLKRSQSSSFADQVDPVRARNNVADEMMPSLEWDDTGIHVYPERGNTVDEQDDDAMNRLFHAESLEMDLEAELASHRSSVDLSGEDRAADSALHSQSNSRSGSHSPRQSLPLPLRASSVDTSPVSPEVGRRTDFAKTVWSSEESGFQEEDHGSSSHTLSSLTLSPIDECENRVGSSYALSSQPLSPVQEEARSPPVRHNRDSAYSDSGLDTDLARAADAIGEPMDVVAYAEREWQGNTQRAQTVVKGYLQMVSDLGLSCVRRVRSDAYCVLRACLYQVLTRDLPLPPAAETLSYLRNSWKDGNTWLSHWSFASRLPWSGDDVLDGMESCLEALDKLKLSGGVREAWNSDPEVDVRCMEAVKLLMLVSALQLERKSDGSVPLFALLLFARDSSSTCEQLMLNHLNLTGDIAALSQMELYLLGYSLGVTIRIVRPDNHGTSDYVAFYPDCCLGEWPMVSLVTEDDRSYYIAAES